ncbi:MAG: helix-turn-helix transcriptional regulator [Spiribacter salinus]|uniref:Helix-turn-helix transcriptional regulator n=1 Tax=Spiribacter salinus TaxID=1335746 RepID=A0A540VTW1_9GAMM|nr:MAG: helix-turn-helix transcriptional regulator [Spiribacter salinus]
MNIKEARRRAGFNQAELGALVGLDQSGISRLERGERPITLDTLRQIARVLNIPLTDLLDDEMGDDAA